MKRFIAFVGIISTFGMVSAQDLHFSQILQSPNLLNPGAVGVYDGWERVALHQRNQWLGGSTSFMSSGINVDACLFKDVMRPQPHLAIGLQFYNDIGGLSKFGTQTGAMTLSGILPMGSGHQLSAGIQAGIGSRKGDLSKLTFDSQWNGTMYDQNIASGESGLNSFNYFDASAGLFYQFDGDNSNFARNNDTKFQFGLAAYHANAPTLKYRTGSTEKLERKYVAMVNYAMDIPNTRFAFDAQAVQFVQGGHYETIFGGVIKRRFTESSKQTGINRDASLGIGCYARMKDAIIPTMQLEYKGFKFGVSYDGTLSALRRAPGIGSLEFSLSYINQYHALFKSRRGGGLRR
jgi:type IX secretion system PorP/SprF family membrane protein